MMTSLIDFLLPLWHLGHNGLAYVGLWSLIFLLLHYRKRQQAVVEHRGITPQMRLWGVTLLIGLLGLFWVYIIYDDACIFVQALHTGEYKTRYLYERGIPLVLHLALFLTGNVILSLRGVQWLRRGLLLDDLKRGATWLYILLYFVSLLLTTECLYAGYLAYWGD